MPDLVILDIRMPVMDGIEMCKQVKLNPALKNILILFLTGDDDEYLAISSLLAGGDHYITKPIPLSIILNMVKELLHSIE